MASFIAHGSYLPQMSQMWTKETTLQDWFLWGQWIIKKQHLKLDYFIRHISIINTEKITFQLEYTSN